MTWNGRKKPHMNIFTSEIDRQIFDATLRTLSPRATKCMAPYQKTFEVIAASRIHPMIVNMDSPIVASEVLLRKLLMDFIKKLQRITSYTLPASTTSQECTFCMQPGANFRLECCDACVHRECWVRWKLVSDGKHCT
jgi:hypothetical protein